MKKKTRVKADDGKVTNKKHNTMYFFPTRFKSLSETTNLSRNTPWTCRRRQLQRGGMSRKYEFNGVVQNQHSCSEQNSN